MTKQTTWYNNDNLAVTSGTRSAATTAAVGSGVGAQEELILTIADATTLDTAAVAVTDVGIYKAGLFSNTAVIPANSTIHSGYIRVDTVPLSGTGGDDILVGTWSISSTTGLLVNDKDADGIIDATDGDKAALTPIGLSIPATGNLINKTVGTADVVVAAIVGGTGPFTAGAVTVVIRYSLP